MSDSSPMNAIRSSAMRCPACPGGRSGCSSCSWPIRRRPTRRSPTSWAFRWAASAPPGDGAWLSYVSCCRRHEPSVSTSTHRPPAASTSREGVPDLGQQVRNEQQHRIRPADGELRRVGHRNAASRHPQALLGGRGVDHRGQEEAIHLGMAQQCDRPGCGAVAEDLPSGRPFGGQPVMQVLSMGLDVPLQAEESAGVADADRAHRPRAATGPLRPARQVRRHLWWRPAARCRRTGRTARRCAG